MKKHRLLFLVSALKNCGPINVVYGIIKGLDRERFDIFLLSLSEGPQDKSFERFEELKIKLTLLNNSRIKGYFLNRSRVQQFIEDHDIDLVHSHGFRADLINSQIKLAQRLTTIHNFPDEDYKFRYGNFLGPLLARKHKAIFKKIPYQICCSQSLVEKFGLNAQSSMEIVQNGIETDKFSPLHGQSERNSLRKKMRLPEKETILLVCGAISYLKNPTTIIEAFDSMRIENTLLIFLGDGELRENLSLENSNSSIRFLGKTDQVSDYLKACNLYISASLTEGMPNSVLEAVSSETPVVLSNIPAHREIVGENYPYLFDPRNPKDLCNILKGVLNNDNHSICKKLSQKVNNQFSIESMSSSYQALYLKALGRLKTSDS